MDRTFAQAHQISLRKLSCPASVLVIDGRPIASGNIIEESEPINIVLDNLACLVSFNIISIPELPWFELHNPNIDWRTREIRCQQIRGSTQKIATISLHQLREEGRKEEMFLFEISVKLSSTT
jgi:hypothetical protein